MDLEVMVSFGDASGCAFGAPWWPPGPREPGPTTPPQHEIIRFRQQQSQYIFWHKISTANWYATSDVSGVEGGSPLREITVVEVAGHGDVAR